MPDYAKTRLTMVDSQLRPNKVSDPGVIDAFLSIPREFFVPEALAGTAYIDEDLPIGYGRYLMEPMILARLIQTVAVKPTDIVLEIGSATGYGAAILSRLAKTVIACEAEPALIDIARANLSRVAANNVVLVSQKLDQAYLPRQPYDVILLAGAIREIPEFLTQQLAEGGRLACVVKATPGSVGQAILVEKRGGTLSQLVVFDAAIPVLPGFAAAPAFVF